MPAAGGETMGWGWDWDWGWG